MKERINFHALLYTADAWVIMYDTGFDGCLGIFFIEKKGKPMPINSL